MFLYASPRKAAAVKHIWRNISYILRLTFCETYPKREKGCFYKLWSCKWQKKKNRLPR